MNSVECFPVIMLHEIGHILKKNKSGFTPRNESPHFKEYIAPRIGKPSLLSGYRKRLTWESGGNYINFRQKSEINVAYVTFKQACFAEIISICFTAGGVFFYRPFDIKACLPKSNVYSANTGK